MHATLNPQPCDSLKLTKPELTSDIRNAPPVLSRISNLRLVQAAGQYASGNHHTSSGDFHGCIQAGE
jgi:hypothetical protein